MFSNVSLRQGTTMRAKSPTRIYRWRRYTVWGWDGEYLTPGFRVECTARQFNKVIRMARERLRRGFIRPLAVLLQPRTTSYDPHLLLIYLNGHSVNPPQRFETEGDPSADRHLKESLATYNP